MEYDLATPGGIKAARKHLNMSQAGLATAIGAQTSTVNNWENGRTAPSEVHQRLIRRLLESPPEAPTATWNPARIRVLRIACGETQKQFAERLGVSDQAVYVWEAGIRAPGRAAQMQLDLIEQDLASG